MPHNWQMQTDPANEAVWFERSGFSNSNWNGSAQIQGHSDSRKTGSRKIGSEKSGQISIVSNISEYWDLTLVLLPESMMQ